MILNPSISGGSGLKFASGSYKGTGKKTKTITCGFNPKLLVITNNDIETARSIVADDMLIYFGQEEYGYSTFTASSNGLTIDGNGYISAAYDGSNKTYYWFAIG